MNAAGIKLYDTGLFQAQRSLTMGLTLEIKDSLLRKVPLSTLVHDRSNVT